VRHGRSVRSRWLWLIPGGSAVLIASVVTLTLSVVPAVGEGGGDGCDPQRSPSITLYDTGGVYSVGSYGLGGVQANIDNYSPWVYNTSGAYAEQYIDLDDINSPTGNFDEVDLGWEELPGTIRHSFIAFKTDGNLDWFWTGPSYEINSHPLYKIDFDPKCEGYCFRMYINGVLENHAVYDWTPTETVAVSEINNTATQLPGGVGNSSCIGCDPNNPNATILMYQPAGSGSWNDDGVTTYKYVGNGGTPSWDNVYPPVGQDEPTTATWDGACAN